MKVNRKKVAFGTKPSKSAAADAWVDERKALEEKPKMKRLTIDITEDLHRRIKAGCAMRGSKIADEVRELLLQKYGKE